MKAAAIATVLSCVATLILTLPSFWILAGHVDVLFEIIHDEEMQVRPLDANEAKNAKLRLNGIEALILTPFVLPILLLAMSAARALQFMITGYLRIGWVGGTVTVLSGIYLILVSLALLVLPEEIRALAPLGIGLLSSVVFLVGCVVSQTNAEQVAGGQAGTTPSLIARSSRPSEVADPLPPL